MSARRNAPKSDNDKYSAFKRPDMQNAVRRKKSSGSKDAGAEKTLRHKKSSGSKDAGAEKTVCRKKSSASKNVDPKDAVRRKKSSPSKLVETQDNAFFEVIKELAWRLARVEDSDLRTSIEIRLRNIKDTCKSPPMEFGWYHRGKEPTFYDRLKFAIRETDPVLAYIIACELQYADLQNDYYARALDVYVLRADDYDEVLGDKIPKKFRKCAAPYIARRKYRQGTNATAADDWDEFLKDDGKHSGGLPTGLPALDAALGGGINGLTIVGADEGDGKTSLCLWMMVSALKADPGLGCVFFSIDQSKSKVYRKLRSLATGLSPEVLRLSAKDRSDEYYLKFKEADAELKNDLLDRIKVVERTNLTEDKPISFDRLCHFYKELHDNSEPVQRGLVIVDMFQSVVQLHQGDGTANELDEQCLDVIKQFMLKSRMSSCPEGFAVVLTSEVRKVDREKLSSNDLRGSARLGSIPDNILLLYPTAGTEQTGQVVSRTLKIAKARNGDEGSIQLDWEHKVCRFTERPAAKPQTDKRSTRSSKRTSRKPGGTEL